ncbi:MAG: hypothetical protein H6978_02345 [Gammaproteobacteria bacterium]|nr:hypothetical protein [Gammaproteobacteria bacterium]
MLRIKTSVLLGPLLGAFAFAVQAAEEDHAHEFTAEVNAFHQVMAPLWHAPKDAERMAGTCATLPQMNALADRIKAANVGLLKDALKGMEQPCGSGNERAFEAAFEQLHDAFHAVSEHP